VSGSELGAVLRSCRLARGWSARGLSLRAGLSGSVAGKIESGAMDPSLRVFALLVHALELSPREVAVLVAMTASSSTTGGSDMSVPTRAHTTTDGAT
jgi:transcriptional regulator with XRE-family HTH domain